MFCQNCGAVETDDAKFCRDCGESLGEVSKRKRFPLLTIWRREQLLGKLNSVKSLFDFSFCQSAPKKIRSVYRLSLLTAAGIALASIAIGFTVSYRFGLCALFISASLTFLFIIAFNRVILDFLTVDPRFEDQRNRSVDRSESRDEIEWNIK